MVADEYRAYLGLLSHGLVEAKRGQNHTGIRIFKVAVPAVLVIEGIAGEVQSMAG